MQSNDKNLGLTPQSFYSSSINKRKIPNRLEAACQSVKMKRVQDFLAEKNSHILDDEGSKPIYRLFPKQFQALDFASNFPEKAHLKVFAFELDSTGKRNFFVCHPQTLWRLLKAKSPDARHAYEVIGEGMHSKLYFDLEFKKSDSNQDGSEMLKQFKDFIRQDLLNSLKIPKVEMIDLDSSTETKFSHHLIVNLNTESGDPIFFSDNLQVGKYVRSLLLKTKQTSLDFVNNFVDEAVYSKNRNFRTFLSSKFGKSAVLKKTEEAKMSDRELFFKSLITFTKEKMERKKLIKYDIASLSYTKLNIKEKSVKNSKKPQISSPFPEIDRHISSLVNPKGGYIRKVNVSSCGWFLTYEFSNYRRCENIQRDHKSNNVKFVVDLKINKVCQTCHDEKCQDFRSEFWKLPDFCAIPWEELFDEDRGSLWNSFSNETSPEEEEKVDALLLEAAEEATAMDQLLLQVASEEDEDLFLLQAAQDLP